MNLKHVIVAGSLLSAAVLLNTQVKADDLSYSDGVLVLTPTSLTDSVGSYTADKLPVVTPLNQSTLKGAQTPLAQGLWKIALNDMEKNLVTTPENGTYFAAGIRYTTRIYTRDISFSAVLAGNDLYPKEVLQSLQMTRKVRLEMGYKVSRPHMIKEINAPWEVITDNEKEVMAKYTSNSFTRATDDVIWIWAIDDLYAKNPNLADWKWFYTTGEKFFNDFYAPWFDPTDGLYRGQSTFQDIQHNGYPNDYSITDCVLLKAASTNALYYKGLIAMANAAKQSGQTAEVIAGWQAKADALRTAFQREFIMPDGRISYYKDRYGKLMPNQHNLGTSLATIFGILTPEQARLAYKLYPVTPTGVTLIDPYLTDRLGSHNSADWPFATALFFWGKEIAEGKSYEAETVARLARAIGTKLEPKKSEKGGKESNEPGDWGDGFGSFHEKIDHVSGLVGGSGSQLWSAAGFMNIFLRHNQVVLVKDIPAKQK
jgi:hypothetical protein